MPERAMILVTGGAGYIGSHAVWALADRGEAVVVPESVTDPLKYYLNNTAASCRLIRAAQDAGVGAFIFSSTAAVYGNPEHPPVDEGAAKRPISPCGSSKLMTEQMLQDAGAAHGLAYGILRYFNVAGADPKGCTGQSSPMATHLIKIASEVAVGARPGMAIFGTDYDTPDGTAVRDYIHVADLIEAHLLALDHLRGGGEPFIANCGYGRGYSVREVVVAMERACGPGARAARLAAAL